MIDVMRSEWTKLRSLRSTVWTLASAFVMMVGLGGLVTAVTVANASADAQAGPAGAVQLATVALPFAAIAMATLGVLVISGEYRTGMIRTSLQAVPQRLTLLYGKAAVFTVAAVVVGLLSAYTAFFVAQIILATKDLDASLGDPGVLRAVTGTGLYLAASGMFGLALGSVIRHTPGAIVTAISLTLVLPQLTTILPGAWGETVAKFFTSNAGLQVTYVNPRPEWLEPWAGFGAYLAWVVVTLLAGSVLLRRRDA
ncbi:ABC transporter permease [Nonomuraea typhae]|uniref:ABC transporter permease n=1 Tax=Nonomuraea typhae TaxID=2603600 RepID=UPI0012F91D9B|nr:ABC transporter permease [Nonomuraea typhae]